MSDPTYPGGSTPLRTDMTTVELVSLIRTHRESLVEVARHPNAYPELLTWLQVNGDHEVREAIAARSVPPYKISTSI
ncbi:MAG: hypothetical protein LBG99_06185 [Propionibacteriaceae bacterium]|jgi:5,10-methylenetetrahydrofolate reductase|nr:hypothetical protein [Propionibacteriaceae bacterium]